MKYTIGSFVLGTLLLSSTTGCGDSQLEPETQTSSKTEVIESVDDHSGHDHAAEKAPGKDTPIAIADKLAFLPEILGEVNGRSITREDFVKVVRENIPPQQIIQFMSMPNDGLTAQALQFVTGEVEQEVMTNLALKAGYVASAESVIKDFEKWLATLAPEKLEEFKKSLTSRDTNLDDYKKKISEDKNQQSRIAISTWLEEKIYAEAAVTEADILNVYTAEKNKKYTTPAEVKVSHIPFKHDNSAVQRKTTESKAEEILRKIRGGAEFDQMVRENPSSDGHLKRLGVLDFFKIGTYNGQFEDAAFGLKVGEVSSVIDTTDGFQIIKLLAKKDAIITLLSEVKQSIKEQLTNSKRTDAVSKVLTYGKKLYKAKILLR